MHQVEDEPMETIHLYVVREGNTRPSLIPVIISILALVLLIAVGILIPYKQPEERTIIHVPAILLPLKTFTTNVSVVPTGLKQYPATRAHGTLIITNGSILSEVLPKGMIFTGKHGGEVITDAAVFVPAGSAESYGIAFVSAQAVQEGKSGNIATLDIDSVAGASIYIRNLRAFTGGADSYSVKFATFQDKENALSQARSTLLPQSLNGLLESPCKETITGGKILSVVWTCQFVTYEAPQGKVLSAKLQGQVIILEVETLARPRILTTK